MKKVFQQIIFCLLGICFVFAGSGLAMADSYGSNFESFTLGDINGQDGWTSGHGSSICPVYDVAVVSNTYGYSTFGSQSLRISNAITCGSFNDQTFSKSLTDEAGETAADTSVYSGGTRQPYFEAQWDFASTLPGSQQSGLSVVASPDRGDPGRMSWVQMQDTPTGLQVNFEEYNHSILNFVTTPVATGLDRTIPHTIKITMQFVDGASNDIVNLFVDGVLVHTGTSWEDYYRDFEPPVPHAVDSIMFRVAGTAAPANLGNGFLIDNFSEYSGPVPVPPATLHVIKQVVNTGGGTLTESGFHLHVMNAGIDVPGSPAVGTASPGTPYSLSPNTYVVSEDVNSSYTQSFSGDCDSSGNVTLSSGDDKTCTMTNTYIIPTPVSPAPTPVTGGGGSGGGSAGTSCNGIIVNPGQSCPTTSPVHPSAPSPAPTPVPPSSPNPSPTPPIKCQRTSTTAIPFIDITNNWAKSYIVALYRQCIIDGRTATLFMPNSPILGSELVKIGFNMFGSGTSSFKPVGEVSRAEALKILFKSKGITDFGHYQTAFVDVAKSDWFYSLIAYAQNKHIVSGYAVDFNKSGLVSNLYSFPRLLGLSDVGKDVRNLKEIMSQLGYYTGEINETYDTQFANAMSAYQIVKNIKATGQMGPATRSLLLKEYLIPKTVYYFRPNGYVLRSEASKMAVLVDRLDAGIVGKVLGASTERNWFLTLLLNYLTEIIRFEASR